MQPITNLDIAIIVFPSILLGILFGYFIGEMRGLRMMDRVALSLIACVIGGIVVSFLLNYLMQITTLTTLLSSISVLGGIILGLAYNWMPPEESARRSHIIFEPYDDEDFEREIEESLRGKY